MSNLVPYSELFDKIESYYLNNANLSAKELEIAERWELGFALLLEHRSKKVAVSKLVKIKTCSGKKLSIAQAYKDISSAERLFAPIKQYSSEFLRLVLLESAFKDVKSAEKWASKSKSLKDWATAMEIKNKAEYRIIQVSGINDIDANLPDFSKLQPSQYNIDLPQELINLFLKTATKGTIDITELMKSTSQDVKFEEINGE